MGLNEKSVAIYLWGQYRFSLDRSLNGYYFMDYYHRMIYRVHEQSSFTIYKDILMQR